ncbi:DegT/DnrJ/EryC1/StrS family aminotransferase [Streptomyces melanogenes]|uniref:DegT/DnrJ/EryC1/StrS family aminotransferase n=1 Tax=Streptomyces melanogenes TaxID=67326 RepID=UPI0037A0F278
MVALPAVTRPGVGRNASPRLYGPEYEAVVRVLESGHFGHGAVTEQFEREVADFLGVPDAVALSSCTAALHTALVAAGVGPGSEVIVPSLTFCATIQAILASGARPRFVDVDPDTLCITADAMLDAVTPATAAVVPVLFGGRAVDLGAARDFLADRGIVVVEDAAHAFGSYEGSRRVGGTGQLTCFSFGPIKNLTCGQGGMVIPRNRQEADRLRGLRMLGVVESAEQRAASTTYRVAATGFRYFMSSINAAIGITQLARFPTTEETRKDLWCAHREALRDVPTVDLVDVDVAHTVPHLCVVKVPQRDRVWQFMRERGIDVVVQYPPNHLQPAFAKWTLPLPVTERLGREVLSLPFHPHLTHGDIEHVVSVLEQALASLRVC